MSRPATLAQARTILDDLDALSCGQLQSLQASGILADLIEAAKTIENFHHRRNDVRVALGLVQPLPPPSFARIWKTVEIDPIPCSREQFVQWVRAATRVTDRGCEILGKVPPSSKARRLELVNISPHELGLENGSTREDLYRRAKALDLQCVPGEIAVGLWSQYPPDTLYDAESEGVLLGMELILNSEGAECLLEITCDSTGSIIDAPFANAPYVGYLHKRWIFLRKSVELSHRTKSFG